MQRRASKQWRISRRSGFQCNNRYHQKSPRLTKKYPIGCLEIQKSGSTDVDPTWKRQTSVLGAAKNQKELKMAIDLFGGSALVLSQMMRRT
jgi:hypothetical protein